jgi:cyclohexanone monooxygenase
MSKVGSESRSVAAQDIDVDALRKKYDYEKNKRVKPAEQREEQYIEVEGEFSTDPYVGTPLERTSLKEQTDVVIVGGGFGGLISATNLKKMGISDIKIIEKAGDFGGTWYWNRYPGAQCDVESYVYMPFLEETGYIPSEKYAHAPEILEHARRIGRHFELYDVALFQTQIKEIKWQEASSRWLVCTDRGDEISARFIISASGPLNKPKFPNIPGINSFKGKMFHTSRWDYDFTGGNTYGGLDKLADKKVAVVGTGATGVQCVPYLAEDAQHLYVVQRTPSNVGVRGNSPTDENWADGLKSGWQSKRMENFNDIVEGQRVEEDLINDGWTELFTDLHFPVSLSTSETTTWEEIAAIAEYADFEKGNELRGRVDEIVKDPETAEKLKAWYPMTCKRPTFNDGYLPAFNKPNVSLIDTDGLGVECITEDGIIVGGKEYAVDCIVFATGFETGTAYTRRSGFEVYGKGGEALSSHYKNGLKTLHGFTSHGFPNCFILGISQNAFKINVVDMLSEQSQHISRIIEYVNNNGYRTVEATAEAENDWLNVINEKAQQMRDHWSKCTPGYYSGEGDIKKSLFSETYGGGSIEFSKYLASWWESGDMRGLELK